MKRIRIARTTIIPKRSGEFLFCTVLWAVLSACILFPAFRLMAGTDQNLIRIGFSSAVLKEVNENDAIASIKVWASELFNALNISISATPMILKGETEIRQALLHKQVDAVALPVDQLWNLGEELVARNIVVSRNGGRITEEFLLLAHQAGDIRKISDLRGRTIRVGSDARMPLASVWLETALIQNGFACGTASHMVTEVSGLSNAVLPVFFRKADACVVHRRGFEVMNDLNPQMGMQLRVIASSPGIIPSIYAFRRGYSKAMQEKLRANFDNIVATKTGKQILTLFQTESIEIQPISCLDRTFDLLETHRRLCGLKNAEEKDVTPTVDMRENERH